MQFYGGLNESSELWEMAVRKKRFEKERADPQRLIKRRARTPPDIPSD